METIQYILIAVFIVSAIVGYFLISHVPSLLHTPLMSGMNALSGITVLGALVALAVVSTDEVVKMVLAGIAVLVATTNIFAGFSVTDRMLEMFRGNKDDWYNLLCCLWIIDPNYNGWYFLNEQSKIC